MLSRPSKEEIDHRTLKLIVGLIALSLGLLTHHFAKPKVLDSISASYWAGGWSQSVFVGFLFAIATFLLAYNGQSRMEMLMSKLAALAAVGVAMFPCSCGGNPETLPWVHYASAGVMFLILVYFCGTFYRRARKKASAEAKLRAAVYAVCGIVILLCILAMGLDKLLGEQWTKAYPSFVFYCEHLGLAAFGFAWLTASRCLPVLTNRQERFSPFQ